MASVDEGDRLFKGAVKFWNAQLQDGAIRNEHVAANSNVEATKLQHDHRAVYATESATTAAAGAHVVHVVRGAVGAIVSIAAGCVVACVGDSKINVTLLVNGSSVLTGTIELDSGDTARALVEGVVATDDVEAGDVLEISITVTPGTGTVGKGLFVQVQIAEDGQ